MTDKLAILYPSILMALCSLGLIFGLGMRRLLAVQKRQVNLKYYRTYSEPQGEPESLRQHSRHVQNHFEVPPLFHLAVWGTFLLDTVTPIAVTAAWLYLVLRVIHSGIHLSYNNVNHRFLAYGASTLIAVFLWARLLLAQSAG